MRTARTGRARRDRGSGLFGTATGLLVFLLTMLAAVQVAYALYARSMLTGAAHDAARHVAGYASAGDRAAARDAEDAHFHERMGGLGDDARLEWGEDDPDVVRVRVVADLPSLLPAGVRDVFGIGDTDREIQVRVEREQ